MAWFHLPSIRSIFIWLRSFRDVITCEDQGNLRNLHTFVVARSTIKEEEVPCMLSQSQMTALKNLHLGMVYRWHNELALDKCWYILEGFQFISNTIEKLSLGIEYYPFNKGYYDLGTGEDIRMGREQFHGFLKQFPRLRSAEVPITLLVGLDPTESVNIGSLLPDTLEKLCLQWDNSELNWFWEFETQLHDCVRQLLADLRSHTPHLKQVTIRRLMVPPDQREYFTEERAELEAMCTKAGIDLEVVFDYLSPGVWTQSNV